MKYFEKFKTITKIIAIFTYNFKKRYFFEKKVVYKYIIYFNYNLKILNKKIDVYNTYYIFFLNLKKKKPFLNLMVNKKNKFGLSAGVALKYLNIKEKKLKKKLSSLYLMLKTILTILQKEISLNYKIIFEIKGCRKDIYLIIKFLKKKLIFKNLILIHTPNLFNNSIKYKKIRAIKKNLKKKLVKID